MASSDTKKTVCASCAGPKCRAPGCKGGRVQDPSKPGSAVSCSHCNGTGTCPSWTP